MHSQTGDPPTVNESGHLTLYCSFSCPIHGTIHRSIHDTIHRPIHGSIYCPMHYPMHCSTLVTRMSSGPLFSLLRINTNRKQRGAHVCEDRLCSRRELHTIMRCCEGGSDHIAAGAASAMLSCEATRGKSEVLQTYAPALLSGNMYASIRKHARFRPEICTAIPGIRFTRCPPPYTLYPPLLLSALRLRLLR